MRLDEFIEFEADERAERRARRREGLRHPRSPRLLRAALRGARLRRRRGRQRQPLHLRRALELPERLDRAALAGRPRGARSALRNLRGVVRRGRLHRRRVRPADEPAQLDPGPTWRTPDATGAASTTRGTAGSGSSARSRSRTGPAGRRRDRVGRYPDLDFDIGTEDIKTPTGPRAAARTADLGENPHVPRPVKKRRSKTTTGAPRAR